MKHKIIVRNISYLTVYQFFNILIPLVTIPYLLRILGTEIYGLIILVQVVVSYSAILVNFGINNAAVGEVSLHQDNKFELSNIVSNIYIIKAFFLLISFLLILFSILFIEKAKENDILLLLSLWICANEFLVPLWYFQGTGKIRVFVFLSFIGQIIFVCLVFNFINSADDYLLLPLFNFLNTIIVGIGSLIIIFFSHKLSFKFNSFDDLYLFAEKSWNFFISELAIKIFTVSNKFIVGVSIGLTEVAYYEIIDKILNFFRVIPLNIIRDSIYPIVSKNKDMSVVRKTTIIMGLYSVCAVIFIFCFSDTLVIFIGGIDFLPSAKFLRFASILIFTTHISNYYITVGLWSFGYLNLFKKLMIYSTALYFIMYYVLWQFDIINLYSLLLIPIIIDIYAIFHYFVLYKKRFFVYNN